MNWVDLIIAAVIVYHMVIGWQAGIFYLGESLAAYLISLWLSIKYHAAVGNFLVEKFGISTIWSTLLGYILIAFISQAILSEIGAFIVSKFPKKLLSSKISNWFGAILSAVNGLIIVTFILLLVMGLPLAGSIKKDIGNSTIGRWLIVVAEKYGGQVTSTLDEATRQAVKFFTVAPRSTERVILDVRSASTTFTIDESAENTMLVRVNDEREKAGFMPLALRTDLQNVARLYSRDMLERKYFGHVSPEGEDVADRLHKQGISYQVAGENLAYAPDVDTAHEGLMKSEGHRHNILDPSFGHIGIGVIDAGIYGQMYTQIFTD